MEPRLRPHVRDPAPWEKPDPGWRPASAWDVAQARRPVDLEDEDPAHLDAWYYWRQRPAGPEVPLLKWPSREALAEHLEASEPRVLRLEPGRYAAQGFHSLRLGFGETGAEVGVVTEVFARPAAFALAGGDVVVVGHDQTLTWIRPEPLSAVAEHVLGGVFFEFLPVGSKDEVVVIHELGALRVTATGEVRWSVDTDVVTGARQDAEGSLCLRELEGEGERVFSLETGPPVPHA